MSFAPSVRAPALLPPLTLPQPLLLIKDKYEILITRGALKASSREGGGGSESYGGHIKYDGAGNGKFVC